MVRMVSTLLFGDGVAAKFVSHHGKHPVPKRILNARPNAFEQRQCNDRAWHIGCNGLCHHPAAFTGIRNMGPIPSQRGILSESLRGEIQQPGTNNTSVTPDLGNLRQIQFEGLVLFKQRKTFRIGLHQSVFDSVVDHLRKMSGAHRTDMSPATIACRSERFKQRLKPLHDGCITTDHQAVTFRQSPDPATGSDVDEMNSGFLNSSSALNGVAESWNSLHQSKYHRL